MKEAENSKVNYKIVFHNIKKFTITLDGQGNKARLRLSIFESAGEQHINASSENEDDIIQPKKFPI